MSRTAPVALITAAMAFLLASRPASALDPKVRITQYRHSAWRVQDGAFDSAPNAITQTADGYIWMHGSHAIRNGRNAVQGLRDSTAITNDLAVALRALGEELATREGNGAHGRTATVDITIQGTPQALRPIIRDDIYRIGSEALRNAFRHARSRRIEAEIRYDTRRFQLRVRDNGDGIEPGTLEAHRAGHFGLPGMRERAEQIGGQVEVWSEAGMGTEVALTIPGTTVYASPRTRRPFWPFAGRRQANS